MTEAPKRIVIDPDYIGFNDQIVGWPEGTEDTQGWPVYIPLADHEAAIAAAEARGREEALRWVGIVSLRAQNADHLDAMQEGRLMAVREARAILARAAEVEKEAGE